MVTTTWFIVLQIIASSISSTKKTTKFNFLQWCSFPVSQFSRSVVSDPMDCSIPGFPVHHQLPELAQTHVHQVSDVIHPIILFSVVLFSSCLQSFPASGSFQMSQLFTWGGQSIGVSASTSVLPLNTQVWSPLGWTGWISLQSKGLSRVFSKTTVQKHQFRSAFFIVQFSHAYMTTGKTIALTRQNFVSKVMSLLFNILSRLVIAFLPRGKRLLIAGCSHHLPQ